MGKYYEPELGQAVFGSRWSEYECPEYIEALLAHLGAEIERVEGNRRQETYDSPIHNNGEHYSTDVFDMRAYYWGEHEDENPLCLCCLPNFKCDDFEIHWYKYLGRGMSMNRPITEKESVEIFNRCVESVRKLDTINEEV